MIDREMDAAMATDNQEAAERDYHEFLEDLEEDRSYRYSVNISTSISEAVRLAHWDWGIANIPHLL